ncbi:PREDICTED: PRKR-interacting protein 1 isoform X2 [Gekko japonicus]|uniref:PRKR-interacting protein 1 isoform X2 n=1 Tax=Gekko japonicus TaxID=146911 RepID=A0ABM1JPW8_GEKJA|nr:PREDICTED: PRKR-interacting protein 1 isoform X2 [Gekko japonicus]
MFYARKKLLLFRFSPMSDWPWATNGVLGRAKCPFLSLAGSSAGAGSGEFHVYRHLRRREYQRQDFMDAMAEKQKLDEEYQKRLEKNKIVAEEQTAKRRRKRQKLKEKKLLAKKSKLEQKEEQEAANSDSSQKQQTSEEEEDRDASEEEKEDDAEEASFVMGR